MESGFSHSQEFVRTLRDLRQGLGYPSSRAFFNGVGGRGFFGCTYRQYLNVESGRLRPNPALMEKIAIGLQLTLSRDSDGARRLLLSYLRSLIGDGDLLKFIVQTLQTPDRGHEDPLGRSLARRWGDHVEQLTREQSEFILGSFENYWVFTLLSNDSKPWRPDGLAKTLGFSEKAVAASLRGLLELRLLDKNPEGCYQCPKIQSIFLHPQKELWPRGDKRLQEFTARMAERKGGTILERRFLARASETELRSFFPLMVRGLEAAEACSTPDAGPDTAIFAMRLLVLKLLPF